MNPRTRAILGSEDVIEKYGVPPHLLCDLQALTGDTAVSYVSERGGEGRVVKERMVECSLVEGRGV
jgi:hypothetical protein